MKRAFLTAYGTPSDVVELHEVPDPEMKDGELIVDILAASINPAELLMIQGLYAEKPPLPYPLGVEAVGRVKQVGKDVSGFSEGDLVLSLPTHNWATSLSFKPQELIKLPDNIDVQQASQIKVNLATAYCLLNDFVELKEGDWIIQNAANSSVGHYVIQLAKAKGIKTVNIVRRGGLDDQLKALGADLVTEDYKDFEKLVETECENPILLALDAVGGKATRRLADCLGSGGQVVNYGLLSGEDCRLRGSQTIFNNISLRGFWLSSMLKTMKRENILAMYDELSQLVADGKISTDIEAAYSLDDFEDALDHAMKTGRGGKVLITPNT